MEVNKIRTRQETIKIDYPKSDKYIIALDAGYSSMKVFTDSLLFSFPTFAKRISEDDLKGMLPSGHDIIYRNNDNGELFLIGRCAQAVLEDTNTEETEAEWQSKDRYYKETTKICMHTAIAYAMRHNTENKEVFVQTGLPSSDLKSQTIGIVNAISSPVNFSLRIGKSKDWENFKYEIPKDAIDVMEQPKGALQSAVTSISTGQNGAPICIFSPRAKNVLFGDTLVLDIGFGTFDYLGFKKRIPMCHESKRECGMRAVLALACNKIYAATGKDVRVMSIQNALETGTISVRPLDGSRGSKRVDISCYIEEALDEIFDKAFEEAENITSYFEGYQNVIIAGGTGEAWISKLKENFKDYEDIEVLVSNGTDTSIPMMYSTVRGYYVSRWMAMSNS